MGPVGEVPASTRLTRAGCRPAVLAAAPSWSATEPDRFARVMTLAWVRTGMTSYSKPDINGPTTAAKETRIKLDGVPEQDDGQPADVDDRLDRDPGDEVNLTDQPGHSVDRRLQEGNDPG